MAKLKDILDLMGLKRSRLENDIGQLNRRRQAIKAQILALKDEKICITDSLVDLNARNESVNDHIVFERWCLIQDQKLKSLAIADKALSNELEDLKQSLKVVLTQEDVLSYRLAAQNIKAKNVQLEAESSRHMELWVTSNRV